MLRKSFREASAAPSWWVLVMSLMLAVCWCNFSRSPVIAQEEAAEEATEAAPAAAPAAKSPDAGSEEAAPEEQNMLMWLIETSGFIGAVILVISIFFVHRVVTLFLEFRPEIVSPPDLVEHTEALLAKRDFNNLYQLAKKSDSPLGQLVVAGMTAMSSGLNEAREAMDRVGEAITVHMEKRISLLAVIGSLGPMIGLLGTLKGMIASFSVIATSGQNLKAAEVAGGISEALVLTFEGVAISVPAIYFFAMFKDRVSTLTVDMQNLADEFIRKVHLAVQNRGA